MAERPLALPVCAPAKPALIRFLEINMSDNAALENATPDDKALVKRERKRADKARRFPHNTCPASRHVYIMGDCLAKKGYPMLQEEPLHCAISLLSVVGSLWEARMALSKAEEILERIVKGVNDPNHRAAQYWGSYEKFDAAMEEKKKATVA